MNRETPTAQSVPFLVLLTVCGAALLILGCAGASSVVSNTAPRWACPSPLPKPWGPQGPVKELIPLPTTPPTGTQEYEEVYYQEWEQEYPTPGLDIFPSPTPYGVEGTNYVFGQRVSVGSLFVQMSTRPGDLITDPGFAAGTLQMHFIDVQWVNTSTNAVPINYASQTRLRAVTRPDGRVVTDDTWGMSPSAQRISGIRPPSTIPPGESRVTIPVIAPIGEPKTAELVYLSDPTYIPPTQVGIPVGPGTPIATPGLATTPTPNNDLRRTRPNEVTIQFTNAVVNIGPPCNDPGALTNWESGTAVAWGKGISVEGVAGPPGADRLVQIAMNQIGKPYVWGSQGPESFDCSGLMRWSYGQIGIRIPQGTGRTSGHGQWYDMKAVSQAEVKPGDLVFFDLGNSGYVDHVAMLVGDINGDGKWDIVHAANPKLGVRKDYSIFESAYYGSKILGFRTAR